MHISQILGFRVYLHNVMICCTLYMRIFSKLTNHCHFLFINFQEKKLKMFLSIKGMAPLVEKNKQLNKRVRALEQSKKKLEERNRVLGEDNSRLVSHVTVAMVTTTYFVCKLNFSLGFLSWKDKTQTWPTIMEKSVGMI